ncbi:unnamed protein product, partial [Rodentolepis nana]|uniref:Carbohydrate deacetylase n=1 Tax=Rodentolepis nana TaxID=102285 RepID=A0A158QH60_RODNA
GVQIAIVADDGFYAGHRDKALFECIENGVITDVSVMMNGGVVRSSGLFPAHSVLFDYCKENSFLPGLHVNLSEGEPLSSKSVISSLLDSRTDLFFDKTNLRKNLSSVDLHHVYVEVENQIIKFEQIFGTPPLRVDGHQHCHVLPGIVEVLSRLLPRHNISWIRIPEESLLKHDKPKELISSLHLVGKILTGRVKAAAL